VWAMTYLLSRSIPDDPNRQLDFLLVQCSTYNTTDRARIAAKAMYDLRRFDVPISVGLYTGEQHMPQLPAAAGFELSDFVAAGGTIYYGESYLAGLMAAATPSDPLFVVEIAPVTSLGGILEQTPALSANVITTAMSGSVYHGYGNSSQPDREYNVVQNITASQAMYAASWLSPLMMVPLDTSGLLHCQGPEWGALIAANTSSHPYAEVRAENCVHLDPLPCHHHNYPLHHRTRMCTELDAELLLHLRRCSFETTRSGATARQLLLVRATRSTTHRQPGSLATTRRTGCRMARLRLRSLRSCNRSFQSS
jgi:hypothetical protein